MKITLELIRILQNISRRVVGNVLINISPSKLFLDVISLQRFYQNCQADLAAVSINGLNQYPANHISENAIKVLQSVALVICCDIA